MKQPYVVDVAAAGITLGALAEWLPPAVTFLTGIWVCLRIYESDTVQNAIKKWRNRNGP